MCVCESGANLLINVVNSYTKGVIICYNGGEVKCVIAGKNNKASQLSGILGKKTTTLK